MSRPMLQLLPPLLLAALPPTPAAVTISNREPRLDTAGRVVNCHDGNIVGPLNGTYFLYGEWYGDYNFVVGGQNDLPKLSVYSSPTLASGSWTFEGLLHNNTDPPWTASPRWPWAPHGAWYSPSAVWSEARQKVILYWSASQEECCAAQWGVAQSDDGVHFELVTMTAQAGINSSLDDSSLLIDDDGVGYVAYTAMDPGKHRQNHQVAIDRLAPNLLSSSGETVAVLQDYFVEGAMLFKRQGRYYAIYGSCCCACRVGSGAVVSSAPNISGPWTRQARDVNCQADAPVCAGYIRAGDMPADRHRGNLTISAQGIGMTTLKGKSGEEIFMWNGMRWLSGEGNPPKCSALCTTDTGDCKQQPSYHPGTDFDYWIPLEFDEEGTVQQFKPFVDEFQLEL